MKIILEIRAAEGGDDAKLLVKEQRKIYEAYAQSHRLRMEVHEQLPGFCSATIEGDESRLKALYSEAGGHRWQRVPPGERKGRVHSSTVTVSVLEAEGALAWSLRDQDIEMRFARDTGPGGQHRNKTESCVVLTHKPTGITAKAAARCQHANRRAAREVLEARVREHEQSKMRATVDRQRKSQVGTGQRGDKVRTYCVQHGSVVDHRTGVRVALQRILSGDLELLSC